jgi:hypothetical protein
VTGFVVLLAVAVMAAPPDERCLEHVARWGSGPVFAITTFGELLVYGRGSALEIATVDSHGVVDAIGRLEFPDRVRDVVIKGRHAYVAAEGAGLRIIDLNDPTEPVEVASIDLRGDTNEVEIYRDLVLVVSRDGLQAFRIDDPSSPVEVSVDGGRLISRVVSSPAGVFGIGTNDSIQVFVPSSLYALSKIVEYPMGLQAIDAVAISGDYLYVAALDGWIDNGLHVYDVSIPWRPVEIGLLTIYDSFSDLVVEGAVAYLAVKGSSGSGGLSVIDVGDPSNPMLIGSMETPWTARLTVHGDRVFLGTNPGVLKSIDVDDPTAPRLIGEMAVGGGQITDIQRSGSAVCTMDDFGIWLIEMGRPGSPRQIGYAQTGPLRAGMAVSEGFAYVSGFSEIAVFDLLGPDAPEKVGGISTAGDDRFYGIDVVDGYAFVATAGTEGGLTIYDVSLPTEPVEVGAIDGVSTAREVVVQGGVAYLTAEHEGLHLFDVSEPSAPVHLALAEVDDIAGEEVTHPVAVSNGIAVVSTRADIRIFDVSDPRFPTEVAVLDWLSDPRSVAISGETLYVLDWSRGLWIIDLSDPSLPITVELVENPGNGREFAVVGHRVFVAEPSSGLDISRHCPRPNEPYDPDDRMFDVR